MKTFWLEEVIPSNNRFPPQFLFQLDENFTLFSSWVDLGSSLLKCVRIYPICCSSSFFFFFLARPTIDTVRPMLFYPLFQNLTLAVLVFFRAVWVRWSVFLVRTTGPFSIFFPCARMFFSVDFIPGQTAKRGLIYSQCQHTVSRLETKTWSFIPFSFT